MSLLVKNVVSWGSQHKMGNQSRNNLCETCGKKPKYVERGFEHPYCSRSCARAAPGSTNMPTPCPIRGCRETGRAAFAGFCSEQHGREAVKSRLVKGCIQCKIQPRSIGDLCVSCDRRTQFNPQIRELDSNGSTFKIIASQFSKAWQDQKNTPTVEKIYEIALPKDIHGRHGAYRKSLGSAKDVLEVRTFYSSQCICDLGAKGPVLCDWGSCGICSAVKSSFKSFAFNVSHNTGRYGNGVYSYHNPALADEFSTSCLSSPYRVMIACDTVLPGAMQTTGHSTGRQTSIDDDERVFVTQSEAIVPAYILAYTK